MDIFAETHETRISDHGPRVTELQVSKVFGVGVGG